MVLNRQKKVRLSTRPLAAFLQKIQRELKLENVEVSFAFVSDSEIARWNESYRHKKDPTDVLSFPAVMHGAGQNRAPAQRMRGKNAGIA